MIINIFHPTSSHCHQPNVTTTTKTIIAYTTTTTIITNTTTITTIASTITTTICKLPQNSTKQQMEGESNWPKKHVQNFITSLCDTHSAIAQRCDCRLMLTLLIASMQLWCLFIFIFIFLWEGEHRGRSDIIKIWGWNLVGWICKLS